MADTPYYKDYATKKLRIAQALFGGGKPSIPLTRPEVDALNSEFGWSRQGVSRAGPVRTGLNDVQAAATHPWYASKFNKLSEEAKEKAQNLDTFGCQPGIDYARGTDPHNDCRDAFRHAYWSARMAQINPDDAHTQGDAHERSGENTFAEHYMDLYNNRSGRQVGSANRESAPEKIEDLIKRRILWNLITGKSEVPGSKLK